MRRKEMRSRKTINGLLLIGMVFYILLLLWMILFKYVMPWELFSQSRYFSRSMNLLPFFDVIKGNFTMLDIYGNILVFIPMGIYISMFSSRTRWYINLLKVAGISFGIELVQYLLAIGASDTTDIVTNSIGGLIGILIYMLIRKAVKTPERARSFITVCSMVVMVAAAGLVGTLLIVNGW